MTKSICILILGLSLIVVSLIHAKDHDEIDGLRNEIGVKNKALTEWMEVNEKQILLSDKYIDSLKAIIGNYKSKIPCDIRTNNIGSVQTLNQ